MADLLNTNADNYGDDAIVTLSPREHIRLRPGMYVGTVGDGSQPDEALYVLIKEVVDNSIDEFIMGAGKQIDITIADKVVTVRDYGRGIPLKSLSVAVGQMNTGGKYGSDAFKKTVGMNGVGVKAVNMLSSEFTARSVRDGEARTVTFSKGLEVSDKWESGVHEKNGTFISYRVDEEIFGEYAYNLEYVEQKIRNYSYLNLGLTLNFNGKSYVSRNGLLDLVNDNLTEEPLYPPIHLTGDDIEVVITHGTGYGESYDSFVNGQHTIHGGTHQVALRAAVAKTVKEFYHKDYDPSDIRTSIMAAISVKVSNPVFENQQKTKFGSREIEPGVSVNAFVGDFLAKHLDDYLHKHPETAQILQKKIVENEKERKAISGIQKKARETAKKVSLNNKKLRDCKIHRTDKNELAEQSMIFITEGNSASGSITKSRDVRTQAVFSLRGKPLNCYGLTKKVVYENEEFNLLQAALNIEEDMDNLRYNKVVIATDADVDGMHIRLLMMTFFLQFFPEVIRQGHLFVLQTPLFRVRNKKETIYCYSEEERLKAVGRCGANAEITRFKGLGEISPDEFREFIGENMRLDKVRITKDDPIHDLLEFYMGKNTYERQGFIIDNLRIEEDLIEQDLAIN
ncbi:MULTISPECIES: DNA topoisomerase IV subunit B [Alistipes]|uniref:DNA topoisomerase (ATP-hydrolyzing) n=4 Tax=Alistipes TaxID=239759 RepID=A0ABY5V596_9BACT|nr:MULTISPECIES: DNA topoisomerase IV subunit B [Alistipes]MBQ7893926.1 type IIA DNA topoisomerase subunit B [Alistipes sp.]MBR2217246.1 type IIA DNA topoisomerase subunit B [Alistipes sp.]MBS5525164.1 type IIA DNA topoisomerase subunit B [Alistipes sp.]MDD7039169.1 DNA topoisomerase IV subunit B [Alistipes senegalensis]MDY4569564.1 DNA topoisomerase IV subunit B [Alistipes senegalensis]